MKPQPVTIHGQQLVLRECAGRYEVAEPATGRVVACAWSRFLAVAEAAKAMQAAIFTLAYAAAMVVVALDVFVWRA